MKVMMVTGSRADWGLLKPVAQAIDAAGDMALHLVATGQHAMGDQGSLAAIREDGFEPVAVIDLALDAQPDALSAARATGLASVGIADEIARSSPDLMMVLGDRYEILGAASAAVVMGLPIAHLCGGDVTEGAFDDAIRHAITKLASLHFVTTEAAARRVRQMGEQPDRVFRVGSTGLDTIVQTDMIPRAELASDLGLDAAKDWALVALHPETRGIGADEAAEIVLRAIVDKPDMAFILTGSNADPQGYLIDGAFEAFAENHANAVFHRTLGSRRFLSALRHARLMIGNSSAGLYEAPSLGVATIDIGDRQKGRDAATSVLHSTFDVNDIRRCMEAGLAMNLETVENPYGDGQSAARVLSVLRTVRLGPDLLRKSFVETLP
ncbi:UDP-N-acetylglucosamine 2-epimerase [Roseibacterium sp. SDUM158016]|jgi:UDP-hydrolysing UDP-N-acetyl-D-glucosamine 2-epimerase|uniref:UDP-N-acetylglucosamine 2-epimerase n=1 Tax=Roseicyclus sediminis TaxID=2980997 RepID=UPI0021D1681D|nr:UDP-N-acetylglucosamine 2-epimerase [Roseibacterium sp. SDUM158016]MCU4654167.1 UDP-N-acetylglucosamine 2-epimerase [Roseibacterium sp. SDUM158016]